MKIAIVDNDRHWLKTLIDIISDEDDINYFSSNKEFGKTQISGYDIIFIEYGLSGQFTGEQIANAIEGKTDATIALMVKNYDWISQNIVTNDHIKAVLDKDKPEQFTKFLESIHHTHIIRGYFGEAMKELNKMQQAII